MNEDDRNGRGDASDDPGGAQPPVRKRHDQTGDALLALHMRGYNVIPLGAGKRPGVPWKQYHKVRAPTPLSTAPRKRGAEFVNVSAVGSEHRAQAR